MPKSPNPIDVFVGQRVRMQRIALGLSQERLALSLDVTFQQLQKYEKGTNRISASRLQALARVMGVEPSFFFAGAPSSGDPMAGTVGVSSTLDLYALMASTEGVALAKAFRAIKSSQVRKRVIDLVEAIAPE
mgnify:CR=1 FL=1